ncbi:MAG TPA: bifunctional 3,4-dihydroxy-2-butanone-4-phosphate synthase/GTP cyclohydrolase II [Lentisphaeria bacterium]|jgi:3,4-dihydroxy 2-butanone 4-phosphate synthase/GTP cyclohydrolase II|nr:bifunctional 3,4-dihydroxy-2-butanone-4-phosphate synthase/GTP cyclohydrolase II [Lentisphaeria bacterium]
MSTVQQAIEAIAKGEIIVVSDDARRENEGDLIVAAEFATPEVVNFMAVHGRGLICAPLSRGRVEQLGLWPMSTTVDRFGTAFTVSVDAREGVTTGISAADRSQTLVKLAEAQASRGDFDIPGHIFPLLAKEGGVLERPGHTEAALDLVTLAGCEPAAAICEILAENGEMARAPDLAKFVETHGLAHINVSDLVRYRQQRERVIQPSGSVNLPTSYSDQDFQLHCFTTLYDSREHIAVTFGDIDENQPALVRIHSECFTGDILHSSRCDCGDQLDIAMREIIRNGSGVLVYLRQEGRGIGLVQKIQAYRLQDEGLDTVEANERLGFPPDMRDYSVAAQVLQILGISAVNLMTNNPAKVQGITDYGIEVVKRLPIVAPAKPPSAFYLKTKRERLGHIL